jgi:hypothetical protein
MYLAETPIRQSSRQHRCFSWGIETEARFPGPAVSGAVIAETYVVEMRLASPKVDLVHSAEPDEWCVTVDGARVLSFSGPSAWNKALSHKAELHEFLMHGIVGPTPDDDESR